jgi:hypothetical protein
MLSAEERAALKESLQIYLTELRRETAATDAHAIQHALAERQRHLEAILRRM